MSIYDGGTTRPLGAADVTTDLAGPFAGPLAGPLTDAQACCAPLGDGALDAEQAAELAQRLKAIADPARLRLLSLLLASEGGEACTCDLVEPLGLTQPTVSHHLGRLAAAGIVESERRGRWTWYRVRPDALASLRAVLDPGPARRPRSGC